MYKEQNVIRYTGTGKAMDIRTGLGLRGVCKWITYGETSLRDGGQKYG